MEHKYRKENELTTDIAAFHSLDRETVGRNAYDTPIRGGQNARETQWQISANTSGRIFQP